MFWFYTSILDWYVDLVYIFEINNIFMHLIVMLWKVSDIKGISCFPTDEWRTSVLDDTSLDVPPSHESSVLARHGDAASTAVPTVAADPRQSSRPLHTSGQARSGSHALRCPLATHHLRLSVSAGLRYQGLRWVGSFLHIYKLSSRYYYFYTLISYKLGLGRC